MEVNAWKISEEEGRRKSQATKVQGRKSQATKVQGRATQEYKRYWVHILRCLFGSLGWGESFSAELRALLS